MSRSFNFMIINFHLDVYSASQKCAYQRIPVNGYTIYMVIFKFCWFKGACCENFILEFFFYRKNASEYVHRIIKILSRLLSISMNYKTLEITVYMVYCHLCDILVNNTHP